jgi:hypothetical protein
VYGAETGSALEVLGGTGFRRVSRVGVAVGGNSEELATDRPAADCGSDTDSSLSPCSSPDTSPSPPAQGVDAVDVGAGSVGFAAESDGWYWALCAGAWVTGLLGNVPWLVNDSI